MSILIKGMEMPKKCLWCPLMYIGFCQVTKTDVNSDLGRRADDCPIVEVPEPHGRLIDENELTVSTDNIVSKIMIFGGQVCYSRSDIDNASTVIEAEGE